MPSSFSSLLFLPQRASASYCLLRFSSAEQLRRRIVAFPFLSGSVLQRELPPPILLWPTALRATQKNKKTQFVFRITSAMRGGRGEEQPLLKSSFEDGLKSAPMDLAAWGHLFSLVGFVLQDKMFDLDSGERRAQVRDTLRHNVASSERSRAGHTCRLRPFPPCRRT